MTKFVDDATSREKRDLYFMKQLMKEQNEIAMQRVKEFSPKILQLYII